MKIIRIASEQADTLLEMQTQLSSIQQQYNQAKEALDRQYLPRIMSYQQNITALIREIAATENATARTTQQQQALNPTQSQPVVPPSQPTAAQQV